MFLNITHDKFIFFIMSSAKTKRLVKIRRVDIFTDNEESYHYIRHINNLNEIKTCA